MLSKTRSVATEVLACLLLTVLLLSLHAEALALPALLQIPTTNGPPGPAGCPSLETLVEASLRPGSFWDSDSAELAELARCLQTMVPAPNTCVFYTGGTADAARDFAADRGKITVYDFYNGTARYFDPEFQPAWQWKEDGHLRQLYRATSRVYAQACNGTADLVHPPNLRPCPMSIWALEELPAICRLESSIRNIWGVTSDSAGDWVLRHLASIERTGGVRRGRRPELWTRQASRDGHDQNVIAKPEWQIQEEPPQAPENWDWLEPEIKDDWAVPATC